MNGAMPLRGVDANLVVALDALLTHRNVTRAGRDVGLTQSSMSHVLARLRAHFGDPLLVAVGREMVLTERAKGLVEPARKAVAGLERVFARPEDFDPRTSRRVFRVVATDNLELYVLPRLAAILREDAPGVRVQVTALTEDWARRVERGEVDLKLGRAYPVPAALESQVLSRERFACVVRAGHPARARLTVDAYAALDHLVVTPTATPAAEARGGVDELLRERGLRRRIAMSVPHFLVAPFIVASSDLVLTAPARLLAPFTGSLALRRVELPIKLAGYELSQVWAARSREDAGHRWLRATIAGVFGSHR
jgi:DNA-binding transcriptional LysR family regulator